MHVQIRILLLYTCFEGIPLVSVFIWFSCTFFFFSFTSTPLLSMFLKQLPVEFCTVVNVIFYPTVDVVVGVVRTPCGVCRVRWWWPWGGAGLRWGGLQQVRRALHCPPRRNFPLRMQLLLRCCQVSISRYCLVLCIQITREVWFGGFLITGWTGVFITQWNLSFVTILEISETLPQERRGGLLWGVHA